MGVTMKVARPTWGSGAGRTSQVLLFLSNPQTQPGVKGPLGRGREEVMDRKPAHSQGNTCLT